MKKIKKEILYILLYIFKYHLKFIYFFIKLFAKQKSRVFLLSRQSEEIPLNYSLLIEKLNSEKIEYKIICKKVSDGINGLIRNEKIKRNIAKEIKSAFSYYINLYKQMYFIATCKVIIIDGYNLTVSMLKHKKNTTVIQMWHALGAIKKFGYQTIGYEDGINIKVSKILCMHKNYDYILSGSKEMNKFFSEAFNTNINKVKAIGTPLVDYLLEDNKTIVNQIYKDYPKLKNKINVLYSPTFRSDGTDNTNEVINSFKGKNVNLILTFHPKTKKINNKNVICIDREKYTTFDVLRLVDYVITDYSALAIDTCVLNKKLFFYVYDYEKYNKENGINVNMFEELKHSTSKDINDIIKIILENKYNEKEYSKFREKYISNLKGNSTEKIIKIIKEHL